MAVDIRLSVDFGSDLGQSWGTLFEAKDHAGNSLAAAGFCRVYNTVFSNDRYALQFHIQSPQPVKPSFERLPRSTTDAGIYLFDLGGRVFAKAPSGKTHPKGWFVISEELSPATDEKALMEWDSETQAWVEADLLDGRMMRIGDAAVRVEDGILTLANGRICYNSEELLPPAEFGFYHHLYYANGSLVFFHTSPDGISIHACPWTRGMRDARLSGSSVLALPRAREYPLCFGNWQADILVFTNLGGTYRLRNNRWDVLREPNTDSYQIYSAITIANRLLLAHYPSGHMLSYEGDQIREIDGWPPKLQGVSSKVREAQTSVLYGGYLYVGVWPWAELWRMQVDTNQWELIDRLFTHPDPNNSFDHPYEREIVQYNADQGKDLVTNGWGQRITSMTPQQDSLFIGTSAKWNWPREAVTPFIPETRRQQYGQVIQLKVPSALCGTVRWKKQRTEIALEIDDHHMRLRQDRQLIAQRTILPHQVPVLEAAAICWGNGQFGKFGGTLVPTVVKL